MKAVLCLSDTCSDNGRLPACTVLPQSTDQGRNITYAPCCATHASIWWEAADWDGRALEKPLMDVLKLEDYVAAHGLGDVTQDGIQLAQELIAAGDDYATAAFEVVARCLTDDCEPMD